MFRKLSMPARIAIITVLMGIVWGVMMHAQWFHTEVQSADWGLMSEVGRKLALGKTLYVDAMDQKGPLVYATYAVLWKLFHEPSTVFLASNVIVWGLLTASSGIAARLVEEAGRPWAHLVAQALIALVIIVPHVGCIEEWLIPMGMLSALWAYRLSRGRPVAWWCWVLVGAFAGYAIWAKFTCAAQFFFLLCYAAAHKQAQGVVKAAGIALGSCLLVSAAVLLWMWSAGSLEGMMEHHVFAATGGYAERMSMFKYLENKNPSSTHVSSFFIGLPVALLCIWWTMRRSDRKLLVAVGGLAMLACCFATFVGYYRMQLAVLAALGACDMPDPDWSWGPFGWIERHIVRHHLIYQVLAIVVVVMAARFTCDGAQGSHDVSERMRKTLHEAVGDSSSVIVWQFNHTWVYAELGLDYPYPIPARYNASQDLWDSTAGADVAANRWQYVVVVINEGEIEVGTRVNLAGTTFPVVAVESNMAVVDAGGGENAPLQCDPYEIP